MKNGTAGILIHILGALAYLSLPVFFLPGKMPVSDIFYTAYGLADFLTYVLILIYFYINAYILLPKLYFERRFLYFFLFTFLFLLLVTIVPSLIHMGPPNGPHPGGIDMPPPPPDGGLYFNFQQKILLFLMAFFFSLAFRIGARWRLAERERVTAELSHLKAQLNPHFLFNTLNSIYSLALEKSDDTPDAVLRLSGMMRYVMGDAKSDFVSLEQEIKYVRDYIDLQKIRFGNTVSVDFIIDGITVGKQIAPLIIIPFVENAFKYGVDPEEDSFIYVHIRISETELQLEVKNKISRGMQQDEQRNGLGVQNTKNRLQHLYPSRYSLDLRETENEYLVVLNIKLL